MNLNLENMDVKSQPCMTCLDLNSRQTKRLLRRICKALSKAYDVEVLPKFYSDGMTCLITDNREIISIICKDNPVHEMFINSPTLLLSTLLKNGTHITFSPIGRDKVDVDMNKMFGTTLEEMNIKLELLGI